jgi:RimJ/RimL family protein N-acetyltransferase
MSVVHTTTLRDLTLAECQLVREWRNAPDVLPMLRTKEPLTADQQDAFYRDVVCNLRSRHRYYAIEHDGQFIGMGGLTYIRNEEAEISLILGPAFRRSGLGTLAVRALRIEAASLGLVSIVGECYDANPARMFWVKQVSRCDGHVRYERDRMFFRFPALPA